MGTGYTRNDSANNIADGNVINAADFDGEYDAIESAFNATSGHTHDGTAGEGGPVTVLGPVQDFVASSTEIKPKTDNTLDIGTSSLEFKNLYLDGKAYIDGLGENILVDTDKAIQFRDTALSIKSSTDGQLDIDADTELELVAPTVDIDASTAVTIDTTTLTITGAANVTGDLDVDNININGNAIISTDSNGNIDLTPNGTGEVNISKVDIDSGTIDNAVIGGATAAAGTFTAIVGESAAIDNITIDANTISSTNTNGNITLDPNGTGVIDIPVATKLQIRDSAIFINSSTDGQLDIDADTELEITSPIVDIDASTSVNISNDLKLDSDAAVLSFGANDDVTLTHEHNVGIQARAASGFELNLQTGDTSVESGNVLGKITFNAPVEGSGVDALLDGASIEAIAEDTFASDNNSTALVFKTNTSAAATERMRIKSDGTIVMDTQVDIDNITIDGNTISSTDTNGNVVVAPHGTGDVQLDADTVRVGDSNANATITTNGTGDLTLSTNAGTNSGVITIADAANGNISITPNGSGTVVMDKVDIGGGAIDGTPVGANSASTGAFTAVDVDNININGNTISSTDTNGNVIIDPAGTGNIHLGVFHFDADQSSLTDNHVLTYDSSGGTIQLEAIPAATIGGNLASDLASNGNNIAMADNDEIRVGAGNDIVIKWDGTDGHITVPAGTLNIDGTDGHEMAKFVDGGAVELYYSDAKKIETTTNGVTVTGRALGAITTVSLGTGTSPDTAACDMALSNDFSITVASDGCLLSFANEVAGQSGNIHLSNANGQAITVGPEVAINETALTAIATAGVYQLSYYCIGTGNNQVLITVSGALT
tara:strand:- start:1266 stop:3761 length:2496 start_codon:yes stop_codon:yes gene_type:complete